MVHRIEKRRPTVIPTPQDGKVETGESAMNPPIPTPSYTMDASGHGITYGKFALADRLLLRPREAAGALGVRHAHRTMRAHGNASPR